MPAPDRPLDSGYQDDPSLPRAIRPRGKIQLAVVERHGDGVVSEVGGAIDQLLR
ncbi:MAG: hypothetical protein ACE148_09750 [Vicinamibacterales bacterium]